MPFETFELSDGLLDAGTASADGLGKASGFVFFVGFMRDHRNSSARTGRVSVSLAGISLIRDNRAGCYVGTEVQQDPEMWSIAFFPTGQIECDWQAVEIRLQMDFGRETAA